MAKQTSKASLLKTSSFALQTMDATKYYDATLSGNGLSATAHTILSKIDSVFTGDSLMARGNNNTLTGGAGNDLLVSSGANNLLVAGAGSDTLVSGANGTTFQVATIAQLTASSISGGSGSDTLRLTAAAQIADAQFARVRGTEVLSLNGASSVVLGGTARAAGMNFVVAGSGNSTLTQAAGYTGALTLSGGGANDLIVLATGAQLSSDSISGGMGFDTLALSSPANFNDVFAKVSGIEVLSLSGASAVTLGGNAAQAGITTVAVGAAGAKIQGSGFNRALTLDARSNANGRMELTGSRVNANGFLMAGAGALASSTLTGGVLIDTLSVAGAGPLADSAFAKVRGIEVLSLSGASAVTLGGNAAQAGITTVSAGSSGVTIQGAAFGNSLTLDSRSAIHGGVLLAGSSTRKNLFLAGGGDALATETMTGGSLVDTLQIAKSDGTTRLSDNVFANLSRLDVLVLGGAGDVTLGAAAEKAGFTSVYGTDAGVTLTQTVRETRALTLAGGKGDDFFSFASSKQFALDSIMGGDGTDTMQVATGPFGDRAFKRVSGIELLSLGGGTSGTLGTIAAAEGISSVVISAANVTLLASDFDMALTLDAGAVSDGKVMLAGGTQENLFLMSNAGALASSTIRGGDGVDILQMAGTSGGDIFSDAVFSHVSKLDVLQLSGGNHTVTLGRNASLSGLQTVRGGAAGGDSLSQSIGSFYLDWSGAASGQYFNIGSGSLLGGDTIIGSGADTLDILGNDSIDSNAFANISGIGVYKFSSHDSLSNTSVTLSDSGSTTSPTIVGSAGANTFNQTGGSYYIDGSAGNTNLFDIETGVLASGDTIIGGAGVDTLRFGEGSIDDSAFANIQGVEVLSLAGSSQVTLDTLAGASGLQTVIGGEGDSTISQSSGSFYLDGHLSSSNIFNLSNASILSGDTIEGTGNGTDTLAISDDSYLNDVDFAHVTGVGVLSIGGAGGVVLSAIAADSGLSSIYGGENGATVTQLTGSSTGGYYFEAGSSDFLINIEENPLAGDDTFMGNGDKSTLSFAEGEISDDAFANASLVGNILLTRSSAIELDTNADKAGIVNVIGGTGDSTFTQHTGSFNLDGSGGTSNLFALDYASLAGSFGDTIVGSGKGDTLFIANDDTLTGVVDADFTNITDVSVLSLTGSSNVALGSLASATGIAEVITGDGDTKIELAAGGPTIVLDGLLSNSLLVTIDDAAMAADETLYGGAGVNTLAFAAGNAITDDAFTNIYSFGALSLSGSSSVTLDANAAAAYIDSIYGGSGQTTITQGAGNANPLMIDGKAGSDLIVLDSALYLLNDTITGGSSTLGNTLAVNTAADITDAYFANDLLLGTLSLAGDSSVVLGSNADNAGVKAVMVSDGSNSFTLMTDAPQSILIDATGSDSNLFALANAAQITSDTLRGGSGVDTLTLASAGSITDSLFKNIKSVEVLELTASTDVTLGGVYSDAAGIASVIGGGGSSTFTQDALSSSSFYLDGSAGTDNLFNIGNAGQAAGDTILGGSGLDTLAIATADSISDSAFVHVYSVAVLQLTGSSDVTLGTKADASSIMSVVGGTGSSTFTQGALSESSYYLDGSKGSSNLFVVDNAIQAAIDTFVGGAGSDTLKIATADSIEDSAFTNMSSVEALVVTGSSDVTLGSASYNAGITSVISGFGATSIDASALMRSIFLNASNSSGNSQLLGGSSADTLTGGSGADTLQAWSSTGNTASDTSTGGTGADLFVLGNAAANAYGNGNSGNVALITDFTGGTDSLQLHQYGTGASDYSLVSGSWGSGATAYNERLYDVHGGGSILLANINYDGSDPLGDLLGAKALFA